MNFPSQALFSSALIALCILNQPDMGSHMGDFWSFKRKKFFSLISYRCYYMFKIPKLVTLAPYSEHVDYPYGCPWVEHTEGQPIPSESRTWYPGRSLYALAGSSLSLMSLKMYEFPKMPPMSNAEAIEAQDRRRTARLWKKSDLLPLAWNVHSPYTFYRLVSLLLQNNFGTWKPIISFSNFIGNHVSEPCNEAHVVTSYRMALYSY